MIRVVFGHNAHLQVDIQRVQHGCNPLAELVVIIPIKLFLIIDYLSDLLAANNIKFVEIILLTQENNISRK